MAEPTNPIYSSINPNVAIGPRSHAIPTYSGDKNQEDPSQQIPGMPPNYGQTALPHVITFQGIVSSVARVYRPSDEAMKDSFANARYMRNDPNIMECLEMRRRSTALLGWHIEPDDEKDPAQKWLCEEITDILRAIPRFTQLRECLMDALWYGKYAVQFRYRWKPMRGGRRVVIDRWLPVNGDKLVFRYDDGTGDFHEDQLGIRVGAGFTTGDNVAKRWQVERLNKVEPTDYGLAYFLEPWERKLLAVHKHMIEDGEYEEPRNAGRIHGVGIRSRIYWLWYQRQECLAWLMEFLERSAFGIEIWYYPWGSAKAREETRVAAEERIGQGRNIILVPKPMGEEGMSYGVERIEPGMQGAEILKDILQDYFGHAVKRYILGQTLTTEADSTGLGSNLASIHLDTYLQIVKYDATNLEETLTEELVKPLIEFNFPKFANVPIRFAIETESPDVQGKLEAWRQAYEMGCRLRESDVMDLIGAMMPEADENALENPQHTQAKQQAAMGAMGGMPGAGMPGMNGPGGGDPGGDDPGPFDDGSGGGGSGSGPQPPEPPGPEDYDADGEPIHSRAERKKLLDPEKSAEVVEQYRKIKPTKGQFGFAFDDDGPKDPEFESKHPREADGTFAEKEGGESHAGEKREEPEFLEEPELAEGNGNGNGRREPGSGRDRGSALASPRLIRAREEFAAKFDPTVIPESLRRKLRPDAVEGVALARASMEKQGGFLCADGTGAGKTEQQLAIAKMYADEGKPVLIVTASEVIKPDWQKGTVSGSFESNSKRLGVELNLSPGDHPMEPGKVYLTTYSRLQNWVDHVGSDAVICLDECHNLKNIETGKGSAGLKIVGQADKVLYLSATPADKPTHLDYLAKLGIFGDGSEVSKAVVYQALGLVKRTTTDADGQGVTKWAIDSNIGAAEVFERMERLFEGLTRRGRMTRRELSMDGVEITFERIAMSDEAKAQQEKIFNELSDHYSDNPMAMGHILMSMRRQQETHKVPAAIAYTKKELESGRQVILFCQRVRHSAVELKDKEGNVIRTVTESEGTAPLLRQALKASGIEDVVELHGDADTPGREAMDQFQSGKARVIIATIQSGGTGINLDDRTGDRPRSMCVLTAPFDAVGNVQAAGRAWRMSSKSQPRIKYLFGDTPVDRWNGAIIASKMRMLHATVKGEVDRLDIPEAMSDAAREAIVTQRIRGVAQATATEAKKRKDREQDKPPKFRVEPWTQGFIQNKFPTRSQEGKLLGPYKGFIRREGGQWVGYSQWEVADIVGVKGERKEKESASERYSRDGEPEHYARHKPAPGQGGDAQFEKLHPRGDDGEFVEKGSGEGGRKPEALTPLQEQVWDRIGRRPHTTAELREFTGASKGDLDVAISNLSGYLEKKDGHWQKKQSPPKAPEPESKGEGGKGASAVQQAADLFKTASAASTLPSKDKIDALLGKEVSRDDATAFLEAVGLDEITAADTAYDLTEKGRTSSGALIVRAQHVLWREDRDTRRKAIIEEAGDARIVEFTRPDGRKIVVSPSVYSDHLGEWQVTQWDDKGPIGHVNFGSREQALAASVGAGENSLFDEGDETYRIRRKIGRWKPKEAEKKPEPSPATSEQKKTDAPPDTLFDADTPPPSTLFDTSDDPYESEFGTLTRDPGKAAPKPKRGRKPVAGQRGLWDDFDVPEKPKRQEQPLLFASETDRLRYHLDREFCQRGIGSPFAPADDARLVRWLSSGIGAEIEVPDRFGQVYRYSRSHGNLSVERFARKPGKGQGSFDWDEDDHPRNEAGEFAKKDSPHQGGKAEEKEREPAPEKSADSALDSSGDSAKIEVEGERSPETKGTKEKEKGRGEKMGKVNNIRRPSAFRFAVPSRMAWVLRAKDKPLQMAAAVVAYERAMATPEVTDAYQAAAAADLAARKLPGLSEEGLQSSREALKLADEARALTSKSVLDEGEPLALLVKPEQRGPAQASAIERGDILAIYGEDVVVAGVGKMFFSTDDGGKTYWQIITVRRPKGKEIDQIAEKRSEDAAESKRALDAMMLR